MAYAQPPEGDKEYTNIPVAGTNCRRKERIYQSGYQSHKGRECSALFLAMVPTAELLLQLRRIRLPFFIRCCSVHYKRMDRDPNLNLTEAALTDQLSH
eukprot:7819967-Pyramimonas_sp.AAC.2